MNILQKLVLGKNLVADLERRSRKVSSLLLSGGQFQRYYEEVEMDELLSISSARNIVELISGTLASFTINFYDIDKKQGKTKRNEDYRFKIMNNEPNMFLGGFNWKKILITDLICKGYHYSYIKRKGNKIIGLYPCIDVSIKTAYDSEGIPVAKKIEAKINDGTASKNNGNNKRVIGDYTDYLILENPNGGVLSNATRIRQLISESEAMSEALAKGNFVDKYLITDGRLSEETANKLKESFEATERTGRFRVLEEGLKVEHRTYDSSLIGAIDMMEARELRNVSLLFGLNMQTLNSVNVSVKQVGTLLLQQVYMPLVENVEIEIERQLLLENEKGKVEVELDTTSLVRLDQMEQSEFYKGLYNDGLMSLNESREALLLPRVSEDRFKYTLATVHEYVNDNVDKELIMDKTIVYNTLVNEQQVKEQGKEVQSNVIDTNNESNENELKDKEEQNDINNEKIKEE